MLYKTYRVATVINWRTLQERSILARTRLNTRRWWSRCCNSYNPCAKALPVVHFNVVLMTMFNRAKAKKHYYLGGVISNHTENYKYIISKIWFNLKTKSTKCGHFAWIKPHNERSSKVSTFCETMYLSLCLCISSSGCSKRQWEKCAPTWGNDCDVRSVCFREGLFTKWVDVVASAQPGIFPSKGHNAHIFHAVSVFETYFPPPTEGCSWNDDGMDGTLYTKWRNRDGADIDGVVLRIPERDGSDTCGAIQIYLSFTSPRRTFAR